MYTDFNIDTKALEIPLAIQESWQKSIDLIAKIAKIPAALVMRVHDDEMEVFRTSKSEENPYEQGELAALGDGLYCETVIDKRSRLLVPNALKDPLWENNPDIKLNMISYIGWPIIWPNGSVFGTICMLDRKENSYNDEQSELLYQFKELIEFSLRSIYEEAILDKTLNSTQQLESERRVLKNLATTDSLTGLYNRRAFTDLGTQLFSSLQKEDGLAAIFAIDLDNFKLINDQHGHFFGDQALRHVSDILANLSRRVDILSRYGGDEFIMLAPITDSDAAKILAQRLVHTVRNTPLITKGHTASLTLSVGLCVVDPRKVDLDATLCAADFALLDAKRNGRDQYIQGEIDKPSDVDGV
ncbi:diguanylate cyclase [Colwelliaceae bacterium 6441]